MKTLTETPQKISELVASFVDNSKEKFSIFSKFSKRYNNTHLRSVSILDYRHAVTAFDLNSYSVAVTSIFKGLEIKKVLIKIFVQLV